MEKRLQSKVMLACKRPQTLCILSLAIKRFRLVLMTAGMRAYLGPVTNVHYVVIMVKFSQNSVVPLMKHICTPKGERRLTHKLKCKNYGIFATCFKNCDSLTTMLVKQWHLSLNVGLNTEYYGINFANLKIMIFRTYLDTMINIMRQSLLESLIKRYMHLLSVS